MIVAPAQRDHLGALPVVLCEGALSPSGSHPERAQREAPFIVTDDGMNHPINDRVLGHFSNKELSTHTHTLPWDSPHRKLTCAEVHVHTLYFPQLGRNDLSTFGAAA